MSFAPSSASLSISIISEAECFFFPLLTLVGSSLSLLTSLIFEVLACMLVCGHGCHETTVRGWTRLESSDIPGVECGIALSVLMAFD